MATVALALLLPNLAYAKDIRIGHNAPVNDSRHQSLEEFAARVAELSDGQMTVRVFPSNTMGQDRERLELMQAGLLEMSLTGEILANFDSRWSVISMPYIWRDQSHFRRFIKSDVVAEWVRDTALNTGLQVIGFIERTPRVLTTRNVQVNNVSDVDGMRIRVPQIPAYMDTWRAFGVEPVPMSSSEFYSALKSGQIDGMENPIEVMSSWRIHEVSKYISFTNHMQTSLFLVASTKFLSELSDQERDILLQAARETEALHAQRMEALSERLVESLRARGMILNEAPDRSGFVAAAKNVHSRYMSAYGRATYEFIQEIAQSDLQ